jgi:hypothetical protein
LSLAAVLALDIPLLDPSSEPQLTRFINIGRRANVPATVIACLEREARATSTYEKITACSLRSSTKLTPRRLEGLAVEGIIIDIFIVNVTKYTEQKSILELSEDEVWPQTEANAKSLRYFVEKLYVQPGEK